MIKELLIMWDTARTAYKNLRFNFKSLILFELGYLLLGVALVFPLVRLLFYGAIRLYGRAYITNTMMVDFLTRPQTLLVLFIIAVIVSIYVVIEMVFLAILFEFGHYKEKIDVFSLLDFGLRKVGSVLKQHHIKVVFPAFLFLFVVEGIHLSGFASTTTIPSQLLAEGRSLLPFQIGFYVIALFFVALFIETIFSINIYTFESLSFKRAYIKTRVMLSGQRVKMFILFVLVNIVLNVMLYLFYALVIALLTGIIFITRGQTQLLGLLLSSLYTTYIVVMTLATIVLIPINYAFIAAWYYKRKDVLGFERKNTYVPKMRKRRFNPTLIRRVGLTVLTIVLSVNIVNTFALIGQTRSPIELLNRADVIAHRGASLEAPENTLSAVQAALDMHVDGVEFDVKMTRDGVPILMHDDTLGRTTNDIANHNVSSVDYSYIQTLDAGGWFSEDFIGEPVPTLEEALALIDGRTTAYIDLKSRGETFNRAIVDIIEATDSVDNVKVMSFSLPQLVSIKAMNEDIETVLLIATFIGNFETFIGNEAVDNIALREFLLRNNLDFIQRTHEEGKNIYVWTVESYDDALFFVDRDVSGLIAKDPNIAREAVHAKNTNPAIIDWLRVLFEPRNTPQ